AAAYAHLGREAMALLRLASVDRQELVRRTRVSGLHQLREALAAGRGVVLVTAHLGNWELGGALLAAHGVRLAAVAQRQGNPLVDTVLNRARERLGVQVIERGRASSRALEALRAGYVVAFLPDQDARRAGVFVPFLGRPASTHRGPALLALRAGAPLFVGVVLRSGAGYEARVEEVEASREGSVEDVVYRLTAAFTRKLELAVRSAPDQYFWHHRRWKTRPPAEPVAARQV
ncbi:MAG: lysophospholipid acyltransferase family protein, partial [Gemmatimonadetes bacterium]|nr:lysophospholipid acyltransferase family protein [Gemmatimonadota bacterium]